MKPLRVMLDSNAFNALSLDDESRCRVETAVANGSLVLVVTHMQFDELSATPDAALRRAIQRITVVATHTAGFVLDKSRVDMGNFLTDEEEAIYEAVTVGNTNHAEDAIILLTARRDGLPVVTNERRLPKRCAEHGVESMTTEQLLARLPLPPPSPAVSG